MTALALPGSFYQPIAIRDGLTLVPAHTDFAPALAALVAASHDQLNAYLPLVAQLHSEQAALAHLSWALDAVAAGELLEWYLQVDGALAGVLRFNHIEHAHHTVSLAYFVGAHYQGQGIALAAARGLLAYGFDQIGIHRVQLRCVTSNQPSMRLAERLGFVREGRLREAEYLHGVHVDHYLYGLLRTDPRG